MTNGEFETFFKEYALNVDQASRQNFWKFSDALILEIIKRNIPDITKNSLILDAGGGTARWAILLNKIYHCRFLVLDRSEDMLKRAKKNIEEGRLEEQILLQQGDLADMHDIPNESVDHVISIYSPISFIAKKEEAMKELYRVLRPSGRILIMGHGYFNAIASKINNYHVGDKELQILERDSLVKWTPHVPLLNVFSKESMETLLRNVGFSPLKTFGIPVFVQPGHEDFDPKNKLQSEISRALGDSSFFDRVLAIELAHNSNPTVANRGMNIFTLAKKL